MIDAAPLTPGIDLHVHTSCSDGRDTPGELVARARATLSLISICDHDTLAAYDAIALDGAPGLEILPGIEISTQHEEQGLHILGYFPKGLGDSLRSRVTDLEEDRRRRIHAGVRRLREAGIGLRWAALEEAVGEGIPGRAHVADALIALGYGRGMRGIFQRYLRGRFDPPAIGSRDAIALVREEGGVAVWAHPPVAQAEEWIPALVAQGLQGLEVHRPARSAGDRRALLSHAARHDLIVTGGSDYHGRHARRPLGQFTLPREELPEALRL